MLVQPPKNLAPQLLLAPIVPDRTEPPLPSGEWGINLAAAQGNYPEKGLKVWIPVWAQQGLGDNVDLLRNGTIVDHHVISEPVEIEERTTLWVAPEDLESGSQTLSYRVTRRNQGAETFEPPLQFYVKLDVPGGEDLDPVEGQHSGLYMNIDPEILRDGVNADNVGDGVDITIKAKPGAGTSAPYPNAALGDVCIVNWGGMYVYSDPVTQDQIDDPQNNPLVINISKAKILEAKDTGPEGLSVTFRVTDRVNNVSTDWCTPAPIKVKLRHSSLPAPIISNTDGNNLHLDALNGEALVVQIWAESVEDFKQNDWVILNFMGTTAEGEAVNTQVRQQIESLPPLLMTVRVPNVAARALAKTQIMCFYDLERGGSPVQSSNCRFVNIIGEIEQLAAPLVEDEQEDTLDPDLPGVEVNIPYDERILVDHAIELNWFGLRANGTTYNPELDWYLPNEDEVEAEAGFFIPVDGKHLKTLEGGTLVLSYNHLRADDNDDIISRRSLNTEPLNVGERQYELVKPIVQGEQDGVLEPEDLPGGVTKLIAPNPISNPTESGDILTFTWIGEQSGETEQVRNITALNKGKDIEFALNAAFVAEHIEANRGKTVTVTYRIWRKATGKTSLSNPLVFRVGS